MAYNNLQDYMSALEKRGELRRIRLEVDPELEITEIASRVMKAGGPALLFERVKGSAYPLLINAMGTESRMAFALGAHSLDEKAAEIEALIGWAWKQLRDFSLLSAVPEALARLPALRALLPRRVTRPLCQEVVDDEAGFHSLPILKCWPADGGRFLTLPWSAHGIRKPTRRTWACIACRCMTIEPPGCIGICTRTELISSRLIVPEASACPWRWLSARIRRSPTPRLPPSPKGSGRWSSLVSFAGSRPPSPRPR